MVYTLYKSSFWGYLKGNFLYRVNERYTKAPHLLYPQFLDDTNPQERQLGSFFGLVLLRKCEELWVFGTYFSKGMRVEIDKARKHGMRIRFFNEQCEEVATE